MLVILGQYTCFYFLSRLYAVQEQQNYAISKVNKRKFEQNCTDVSSGMRMQMSLPGMVTVMKFTTHHYYILIKIALAICEMKLC